MEVKELGGGWEALGAEVAGELAAWREAHPRARLAEIEEAVLGAVGRLQARALEDLAHATAAAEVSAGPLGERLSFSQQPQAQLARPGSAIQDELRAVVGHQAHAGRVAAVADRLLPG